MESVDGAAADLYSS